MYTQRLRFASTYLQNAKQLKQLKLLTLFAQKRSLKCWRSEKLRPARWSAADPKHWKERLSRCCWITWSANGWAIGWTKHLRIQHSWGMEENWLLRIWSFSLYAFSYSCWSILTVFSGSFLEICSQYSIASLQKIFRKLMLTYYIFWDFH